MRKISEKVDQILIAYLERFTESILLTDKGRDRLGTSKALGYTPDEIVELGIVCAQMGLSVDELIEGAQNEGRRN